MVVSHVFKKYSSNYVICINSMTTLKYSRQRRPVADGGVRGGSRADIRRCNDTTVQRGRCLIGVILHVEGLPRGGVASRRLVLAERSQTVRLKEREKKVY